MILDFHNAPKQAASYDVLDAATGACLNDLHIIHADDELGLIRRYAIESNNGDFVVDESGLAPVVIEERRPIRIELKASHRGAIAFPKVNQPERRRQ